MKSSEKHGPNDVKRDLSKRVSHEIKVAQDFRDLSDQTLVLSNQDIPRFEFLQDLLIKLKNFSNCDAVGLRLREGDKFLLCEISDRGKSAFRMDFHPCVRMDDKRLVPYRQDGGALELVCRNVFLGRFHPSSPHFTNKGSFRADKKDTPLSFLPESEGKDLSGSSGALGGYESFALVPIHVGEQRFGILQLKSRNRGYFSGPLIELYEEYSRILGVALSNQMAQSALRERVKELNCLYGLSRLAAQPNISMEAIFESTMKLIPPAWQYPEITCARIVFKEKEFTTANFRKARWNQKAPLIVDGIKAGAFEVYYLEKKPGIDEGPFLKEERDLLNAMASMLGSIVEHRQAEMARSKLAAIVKSSDDAIIGKTIDGVVTSWNKGAEKIYGYKIDEMLGRPITILTPADRPDEILKIQKRIKRGEFINHYETRRIRKDGRTIDVSLSISPIKDPNSHITGISTIARDITEHKRAEEALRDSEHALQERVKELTCLYNLAMLAEEPEKPLEELLQGVVTLIPPAWQYPQITHGKVTFDGQVFLSSAFKKGRQSQTADIYVRGEKRGTVEVSYAKRMPEMDEGPFLKEERSLIEAVAKQVGLIVERREAEQKQRKLQEQLRHSDRLATIGQLAAGVAHELNEPLGNILGFAQLAIKSESLSEPVEQDLAKIISASLYAREIIKKLMLFARQTPPQKTKVDLNDIVNEGIDFLEIRAAKEGIKIVRQLSPGLPKIIADSAQLTQVLVNLVVNAIQSMPRGGTLTIRTMSRKGRLSLIVKDTGIGMSEEVRKNIFLPFYTTKDIGKGTGLGLAVVHGIVTSHGGSIIAKSQEGRGSCFEIQLPQSRVQKKVRE